MSDKLNHSDLSALLAKETGISLAKSEAFTKALFDLIIEGLENDGLVKINGLGTFKVTEVADRYSVNVNTGEKFEIKGHKKLTFVPADTLKDSVNKPFAMFAPVEVDESYQDDADVLDGDDVAVEQETMESVAAPAEETAVVPVEEPATDSAEETDVAPVEDPATDSAEETAVAPVEEPATDSAEETDVAPVEDPATDSAEETDVAPVEDPATDSAEETDVALVEDPATDSAEETAVVPVEEPATDSAEETAVVPVEEPATDSAEETAVAPVENPATEPAEETAAAPVEEQITVVKEETPVASNKKKVSEESLHRKRNGSKTVITIAAMLALGFVYYWFIGKNEEEESVKRKNKIVLDDRKKDKDGIVVGNMLITEGSSDTDISVLPPANDTIVPKEIEPAIVEIPAEKDPKFKELATVPVPAQQKQVGFKLVDELSVRKDKDIKIEDTTLYNITGEVAVHKVAEGENLAKISNKYYNSRKLWPYIAKHNNMSDPGDIVVGMELSIPELQPK